MTTNLERAAIRKPWLKRLEKYLHCSLEAPNMKVPTSFSSPDGLTRVVLRVTPKRVTPKRVTPKQKKNRFYFFSFEYNHEKWLRNRRAKRNFVAFGCGSAKTLLLIPFGEFAKWLDGMYLHKKTGWKVHIYPNDHNTFVLRRHSEVPSIDLTKYLLK